VSTLGRAVEDLPVDRTAPGRARAVARAWLDAVGWTERTDDVVLLVSELVVNAVVGASGGSIRLTLSLPSASLRCEVTNVGDGWPVRRVVAVDAPSGRGLHLVHQLASRWGSSGVDGSTMVWFELDR
jgi:anti-sigma regulatory factor (Ser/Thr protein kinase)